MLLLPENRAFQEWANSIVKLQRSRKKSRELPKKGKSEKFLIGRMRDNLQPWLTRYLKMWTKKEKEGGKERKEVKDRKWRKN